VGTSPDQIRADIDRTRAELTEDVERLAERTTPRRIVRRRVDRARSAWQRARERVMGAGPSVPPPRAGDRAQAVQERTQQAVGAVSDTARHTAHAVRAAPHQVLQQTQGNPIAAGLIAFGAGLLAASLFPRSRQEQRMVRRVGEQAGPFVEPVTQAAAESVQRLKEDVGGTVQEATQEVKGSATQAAWTTGERMRLSSQQVAGRTPAPEQHAPDEPPRSS